MSANLETTSKKRRGEGPDPKPSKKIKHTTQSAVIDSSSHGKKDTDAIKAKKIKGEGKEKVELNGGSHKEKKKASKLEKSSEKIEKHEKKNRKMKAEDDSAVNGKEREEKEPVAVLEKKPSKSKRKLHLPLEENGVKSNDMTVANDTSVLKLVNTSSDLTKPSKPVKKWSWSTSPPFGGRFEPLDLVFSVDEQFVLSPEPITIY
jgi:hypothetical protein